jgi:hypothetical protein
MNSNDPPSLGLGNCGLQPLIMTPTQLQNGYWLPISELDKDLKGPQVAGTFETSEQPFKVAGQTYDGVWISMHQPKFAALTIYDHKTGLLLQRQVTSQGAPPKEYLAGEPSPTGDVFNLGVTLMSVRDINIPWANEAMPDWLLNTKALHYRTGYTNTGMQGPPVWVYGKIDTIIQGHGNGWLKLSTTQSVGPNAPLQPTLSAWAPDLLGSLWVGPVALSKLQQGQVLDEDPITQMRVVVTDVNNQTITITESNGICSRAATYDKQSGLNTDLTMTNKNVFNPNLAQVNKRTLEGRE